MDFSDGVQSLMTIIWKTHLLGCKCSLNLSLNICYFWFEHETNRNFQLLVDWTRGKNLIISSAAASVSELRGPYDVANLFSLIGLPFEHAKAAVSKNCRYAES